MEKLPGEPGTKSFAISSAVVTGLSGVALGPVAAMVSAGMFGVWNERTLAKWARFVDSRLAEQEKHFNAHDPQTVAIFNKLTFAALQTSRHDKWELLVDALSNSGSASSNQDSLQELFADYVIKYTPQHVLLLFLAASPQEWLESHADGASGDTELRVILLDHVFDGPDDYELMSETYWDDLHRDGMLLNRPGGAGTIEDVMGVGWMATEKGRRFLRHLGRSA